MRVNLSTVERTREHYVFADRLETALKDRPPLARPRKLDASAEAFLMATAWADVPAERAEWPMQLLADRFVAVGMGESGSDETVRQPLKKTTSSRG